MGGRGVRLRLSSGAFFQANRDVAALAYAAIADALAVRPDEHVVDAYCGIGGIALALAGGGATEVVGIEEHAGAVADAAASAALNDIDNARFVAGDVARELAAVDRADVVVLNPPRKGCALEVLAEVVRLAPARDRLSVVRSAHARPRSRPARDARLPDEPRHAVRHAAAHAARRGAGDPGALRPLTR